MAKVLGVGGIFFKAQDPKGLSAWYVEWLGFELDYNNSVSFKPDAMPSGGATVWGPFRADTDYFDPSDKPFMFNLVVDDLEGALAQVKEGGATIVGEIERYDYGSFGWFIDPEGNKVELWMPPAASS